MNHREEVRVSLSAKHVNKAEVNTDNHIQSMLTHCKRDKQKRY